MHPLKMGNNVVHRVAEIDHLWVSAEWLYPNITPDQLVRNQESLGSFLVDSQAKKLALSFHSYVIQTPTLNILVDTCNGNHKPRTYEWQNQLASDAYLQNLKKIGLTPDDIDVVLCSHLHADHVGWNTQLVDGRWVPTFPKAKYIIARQEFDHYNRMHAAKPERPVTHGAFADSVLPVVEAKLAEFVDLNHVVEGAIGAGVWMEPSCGHTPGHVTIHVAGGGRDGIMAGDIIHHPILFTEPNLVNVGDFDPPMAANSRRRLIERCADTDTYLLTMHFPSPTAGHVRSTPNGLRFFFVE